MKFNWAQVNKQSLFLEHMSHNVVYWQKRWNFFFSVWYTLFQCDCQLRFVIHKVMHRLVCLCHRDEVERYIPMNSCPSDEMSFTYMASGPSQPPNTFCDDCSSIGWDIFLLRFQLPGVFGSITNRKWKKKVHTHQICHEKLRFGLIWTQFFFLILLSPNLDCVLAAPLNVCHTESSTFSIGIESKKDNCCLFCVSANTKYAKSSNWPSFSRFQINP